MNIQQLEAAAALGCRIQIWHLRPGATSSADGQWDTCEGRPSFQCPIHLYRVHPDDLHLLRAGHEKRAWELLRSATNMSLIEERTSKGQFVAISVGQALAAIVAALEDSTNSSEISRELVDRDHATALQEAPSGSVGGEAVACKDCDGRGWLDDGHEQDDGRIFSAPYDCESCGGMGRVTITRDKVFNPAPPVVDESAPKFQRWSMNKGSDGQQWSVYMDHDEHGEWVKWPHVKQYFLIAALAQPQGRGAVDLEQFREAVELWKLEAEIAGMGLEVPDERINKANRLLALIDAQSAKGDGDA